MHHHRAANRYRSVSLQSASGPQILGEVFHRLMVDLDEAGRCIEARNIAGKAKAIGHAIDLVGALAASLEHETAPELCAQLEKLYGFVTDRLLAASAKLEVAPLAEARKVLTQLREAFAEAAGASP
jgi:flagellar protein FliS